MYINPNVCCFNQYWLVVEPYPPEEYEFVSWGYYSQYMEKS